MFIGTNVDGFFRVKCPVSLQTSVESRVQVHQFADGSTSATVFGAMPAARAWEVDHTAVRPGELALLESMCDDPAWYARGTGVQFLPTGGERVNLLSREESSLRQTNYYAPLLVQTPEGPSLGVVSTGGITTRTFIAYGIPVPEGAAALTFSAYVRRDARLLYYWRDVSGASIGSSVGATIPGTSAFTRGSTTQVPPEGAKYLDLQVGGEITRPALTLGTDLYAWGEGERVPSVVVERDASDLQWAGSRRLNAATFSKKSFRISELRQVGA